MALTLEEKYHIYAISSSSTKTNISQPKRGVGLQKTHDRRETRQGMGGGPRRPEKGRVDPDDWSQRRDEMKVPRVGPRRERETHT